MTQNPSSLGHRPDGPWAFDNEVTRIFDDMLSRSIPQLEIMRELVFAVGRRFVQPGTAVVDLGCSRGGSLAPFVETFRGTARFIGVDMSSPMLTACRARFQDEIAAGDVSIFDLDLQHGYPTATASLTLAVLTLQFIPPEHRNRILRNAHEHTVDGGALIVVEKVRGASPEVDAMLTRLYHDLKQRNGYTQEDIERKRLSLEGVLEPMTAEQDVELLQSAEWVDIECFWRALNFAAWIAVKQ